MMFFDAHNHLNSELFEESWVEVVSSAKASGVVGMINNGGDLASSKRAAMQAHQIEGIYVAAGIHPEDLPLRSALEEQLKELESLAADEKVVAIGELGLDYTLDVEGTAERKTQLSLIEPQLDLAKRLNLPVVLHVRDVPGSGACFADILALLDNFKGLRGQFHCWTAGLTEMEEALNRGFYISFSGILTYGTAGVIREVATVVPADKMLVETDGPFLVPEPRRSEMRKEGLHNNERLCLPEYVTMTTEMLAILRGQPIELVAKQTTMNAQQLFALQTT